MMILTLIFIYIIFDLLWGAFLKKIVLSREEQKTSGDRARGRQVLKSYGLHISC